MGRVDYDKNVRGIKREVSRDKSIMSLRHLDSLRLSTGACVTLYVNLRLIQLSRNILGGVAKSSRHYEQQCLHHVEPDFRSCYIAEERSEGQCKIGEDITS